MDDRFAELARTAREVFWREGMDALHRGEHVLFDWSLWSRARRSEWISRAERAGSQPWLLWLDVPVPLLRQRLEWRNQVAPRWAVSLPIDELDRFAPYFEKPSAEEGIRLVQITATDSGVDILRRIGEAVGIGER